MNAKKKLALNTITSFLYEITAIVCAFILPRAILSGFGSEVNGLTNSVSQFLSFITVLDLGVGRVVQSSFYQPLADKDNTLLSKIYTSGQKFFSRFAIVLTVYIVLVTIFYPFIHLDEFDYLYTATLVIAIGISLFGQFYFGVVDAQLLSADQKGFVNYSAQIVTLIVNTIACVIIIDLGASIQIVKLVTSLIFLTRPLFLRIYVDRHYKVDRKIKYEGEPIKQKWNGLAQHISSVVLTRTDVIILTLFSTLSNVSIYSVYFLVVNGICGIFASFTSGFVSLMGELWAKKDYSQLSEVFSRFEWLLHSLVTFVFGSMIMLITQFIQVYTSGITDADYYQPLFAVLLVVANAIHCYRLPYTNMIFAANEFKSTQISFIVAAIINIVVSIVTVFFWGLIGVAIGTLVAMTYHTIWVAIFNHKHLVKGKIKSFIKQMIVNILTIGLIVAATFWIQLGEVTYFGWIIMALEVAGIAFVITLVVNIIFYRKNLFDTIGGLLSVFKKKARKQDK